MEKEILLEARNVIDDIYKNGINRDYLRELYRLLGNDTIPFIFESDSSNTAAFNPNFMYITVNEQRLDKWIDDTICNSLKHFDINNIKLLKSYLVLYVLLHEIEHSNQQLIAEGEKEPNYDYEKNVYHDVIYTTAVRHYSFPRPISFIRDIIKYSIYHYKAYHFIMERNAMVEGYNFAANIAEVSNDKEMLGYFTSVRSAAMLCGYRDNSEGCLKYTYRQLGMMRKYKKIVFPNDISLEEKVRRGLELTNDERDTTLLSLTQKLNFK